MKYVEIQKELNIPAGTWDYWHANNFKDFADNLRRWKQDRLLMMIEPVFEEALESDDLKTKVDVANFIATNLESKTYKKRRILKWMICTLCLD